MKRASLSIIAVTFFLGATLSASVKTAQEPRPRPSAAGVDAPAPVPAASLPAGEAHAAEPQPAGREPHPAEGAQPGHQPSGEALGAPVAHEAGEAEAAESPWATVARLFNFALLAGILVYLLRSPFGAFLDGRRVQIKKELTDAAEMKESAAKQVALIEQKMQALPRELESLKQRGTSEIAAEEESIRQAAEAERQRMLENATREIDRRAQLAERRLTQRAGELAVDVATERVRRTITDADQSRLVDRYLEQVRSEAVGS